MNPLLVISLLLNAIGVILSVSGAIANALGKYKTAFSLWIVSNAVLLCLFVGVALDWWVLNSGAWFQVGLYAIFCITSSAGFIRESREYLCMTNKTKPCRFLDLAKASIATGYPSIECRCYSAGSCPKKEGKHTLTSQCWRAGGLS